VTRFLKYCLWAIFALSFFNSNGGSAVSNLIVAQDGSGDFTTIQAALDAVPVDNANPFVIYIKSDIYNEKIYIEKDFVTLQGENRDSTRIVFAELRSNWRRNHPDDYGAAAVNIKDGVTDLLIDNLTVHNNYGGLFGSTDHQFAVRGGGNRVIFLNSNFIADGGDTVSLWNGSDGMYYHRNCYFKGYVDFVCPRGWCFIIDCKFYGRNLSASIWHDGSKDKRQKFVIRNSRFDGVKGFPLGRYHRDAQFFLLDCTFSKNMADRNIYYKTGTSEIYWGQRAYYYNCHGDSVDYAWHAGNLKDAEGSPKPEQINAKWTFEGKWDPEAAIVVRSEN